MFDCFGCSGWLIAFGLLGTWGFGCVTGLSCVGMNFVFELEFCGLRVGYVSWCNHWAECFWVCGVDCRF